MNFTILLLSLIPPVTGFEAHTHNSTTFWLIHILHGLLQHHNNVFPWAFHYQANDTILEAYYCL